MRRRICLSIEQGSKRVERPGAAVQVERLLERKLDGLLDDRKLTLFINCMRKVTCVAGVPASDGDVRMALAKSGFTR